MVYQFIREKKQNPFVKKQPAAEKKIYAKKEIIPEEAKPKYSQLDVNKMVNRMMGIYKNLVECSGFADAIAGLKEHGDLEKKLKQAREQAKLLPKQLYDSEEVQEYISKIKKVINYRK